jgi:hypothetical protein
VSLHPRDRYKLELHQWGLIRGKDRIEEINEEKGQIVHKISTVKGQSGSPILLTDSSGKTTIIGIHKGGVQKKINDKKVLINVGRLVTQGLLDKLSRIARKLKALPFRKPEESSPTKKKEVSIPKVENAALNSSIQGKTQMKQKT